MQYHHVRLIAIRGKIVTWHAAGEINCLAIIVRQYRGAVVQKTDSWIFGDFGQKQRNNPNKNAMPYLRVQMVRLSENTG